MRWQYLTFPTQHRILLEQYRTLSELGPTLLWKYRFRCRVPRFPPYFHSRSPLVVRQGVLYAVRPVARKWGSITKQSLTPECQALPYLKQMKKLIFCDEDYDRFTSDAVSITCDRQGAGWRSRIVACPYYFICYKNTYIQSQVQATGWLFVTENLSH